MLDQVVEIDASVDEIIAARDRAIDWDQVIGSSIVSDRAMAREVKEACAGAVRSGGAGDAAQILAHLMLKRARICISKV